MRKLLTREDIAERMGVAPDWLRANMGRLAQRGFPRALPLPGRMARWDPLALDRWLDRWLDPQPVAAPPLPPTAVEAEDDPLGAELLARAKAIAESMGQRRPKRRADTK